ncbi:MAG: hypothetical protein WC251_02530 [Candidatus Izemoplasmatales bacterium]|nr:hypothetical protein [Candidatus Izemoplasmatales bacterium]
MRLMQKLLFITTLIIISAFFIYTLSFSTGWALGEWFGDFFTEAQVFNKLIFKWSLWTIIMAALSLLFANHTGRRYYVQNYVAVIGLVFLMIRSGLLLMDNLPGLKTMYEELPEALLTLIVALNYSSVSTFVFDLGIVFAYLLFVLSGLIVAFTIIKTIVQIKANQKKKIRREAKL